MLVCTLAFAVPLAMDPGGYFIFLPLKWALTTALVAAGMAAAIIERRGFARDAATAAWAALLAVVVLAALVGKGGLTSWIGYPGRYLGVIAWAIFLGAFVLGRSLTDEGERTRLVRAAAAGSLLVSAYAVLQELGIDLIEWEPHIDTTRARSTLGNAAFLGAFLAMIVPLTGRLALAPSSPRRARALYATAATLGTVALLTTETRGAWLGALMGVLVMLALDHRRLRALPRREVAVVAAAVLVGVIALATVSPYAARVRSIVDPSEATGEGRLIQWERTFDLVAERPLLGWGPETYVFTFPQFIDAEFEREVGRTVIPDRAHNLFLDVAATTGFLGVVAFLAVVTLVARGVTRDRQRDPLTVGLAGACVAYLVQLQFSISLPDLDAIFWLLAGVALAAATPARVQSSSVAPTQPAAAAVPRAWAIAPVLASVIVLAWGGMEVTADRTLRRALESEADGDFLEAQRLVDRAADRAPLRAQYLQGAARLHGRIGELNGRGDDFERALAAIDDARGLVPKDLELDLDRADVLLAWGEVVGDGDLIADAALQYEAIIGRDRFSSRAHLRLGVAYVQLDRSEAAEAEWLTAASLAPDSPAPLVNLGRLYAQEGREDDARRALGEALRVDPGNTVARDLLDLLDGGGS